jgi:hypothetical protein
MIDETKVKVLRRFEINHIGKNEFSELYEIQLTIEDHKGIYIEKLILPQNIDDDSSEKDFDFGKAPFELFAKFNQNEDK